MFDAEPRGQLVLRVWGSFIAGLFVVALLTGAYEAVVGNGISPPVLVGAMVMIGLLYAVPLLIVAALVTFFLADRIIGNPLLWSGAATVIASFLCFLFLPHGMWIAALFVSTTSTIILYVWLARRPLGWS